MKRLLIIMLATLLLCPFVLAEDIAYVVKDSPDQNILDLINEEGYSYQVVTFSDISSTDFSQYDFLVVGDGDFENSYLDIPVNEMNAVVLNYQHLEDWNWVSQTSTSNPNQPSFIGISNYHEIVEGLPDSFRVYEFGSSSYLLNYLSNHKKALGFQSIVVKDLSYVRGDVVAIIEDGGQLRDNQISNSNSVFIGFGNGDLWSNEAEEIFKNSLSWISGDTNEAPLAFYIEDIEWETGSTYNLDLDNYFDDPEGEDLTFEVADTSDQEGIFVELVGSIVRFSVQNNWVGSDWIIFSASDGENRVESNLVNLIVTEVVQPNPNPAPETPEDAPEFNDASQCSIVNENIKLEIKDPGEDDDFVLGDKIIGELEIKNDFDEEKDFDIEFYIYDLDEDEEIVKVKESVEIKDGRDEDVAFEIEIPYLDVDNDLVLYVYVETDDECNFVYQDLDVEKKEHDVVIEDLEFDDLLEFEVVNLGDSDEEIYVEITNSEIGLNVVSDKIDLDEDDDYDFEFDLDVPAGEHEILVKVYFDDSFVSEKISVVGDEIIQPQNYVSGDVISLGEIKYDNGLLIIGDSETYRIETYEGGVVNLGSVKLNDVVISEVPSKKPRSIKLPSLGKGNTPSLYWILNFVLVAGIFVLVIKIVTYRRR